MNSEEKPDKSISDVDLTLDKPRIKIQNGTEMSEKLFSPEPGAASLAEKEGECVCCGLKPRCLQICNNIKAHVFWQCVFNFFEGFMVNGILNVILVALETRYSLSSTKSSLIASANDFGAFVFLIFIGLIGENRHKPRIMGCGIAIMAAGAFIFMLPHFIGGRYHYVVSSNTDDQDTNLCAANSTSQRCDVSSDRPSESSLYFLFLIGQILLGVGAVPMFTLGLTYLDENAKQKMTSLYTGLVFSSAAVGVAAGYVVGGLTLKIFVDVGNTEGLPLTPATPQWVGAWWIGVLVGFFGLLAISIPFFCYPKRMPGYGELRKTRRSEAYGGEHEALGGDVLNNTLRNYSKALYTLVTNPCYVMICLAGTCEALVVSGTATFGAKILQQWFSFPLGTAGLIMGAITVPGAGGGMILGGYLVKRFKLKFRGIIRLCACFTFLSLVLAPSFLVRCGKAPMVGVDFIFSGNGMSHPSQLLTSECNSECGCSTAGFEPVCAGGKHLFFSPCHAGCYHANTTGEPGVFQNCRCINQTTDTTHFDSVSQETSLVAGMCLGDCPWLPAFSILFFFFMVVTFSTYSPTLTAVLRCVPFKHRSLAVSIQLLSIRLMGTTPGPILLGAIIDSTCLVWQETCGSTGICWVYNHRDMALRILGWCMVLKAIGCICFTLASLLYRKPEKDNDNPVAEAVTLNISEPS